MHKIREREREDATAEQDQQQQQLEMLLPLLVFLLLSASEWPDKKGRKQDVQETEMEMPDINSNVVTM